MASSRRQPNDRPAAPRDALDALRAEVLAGLQATPRLIPSRYLYDQRGSALFERICRLPEYYLTRVERSILVSATAEIAGRLGPRVVLIEPGAGNLRKATWLLARLPQPAGFVPIDVSAATMRTAIGRLRRRFPALRIEARSADFSNALLPLPWADGLRRVVFFPGSTIGNFAPSAAVELLARMAGWCGREGALLIGVDRKKPRAILERAYDDAQGVSAAFALNVLQRINAELGGEFRPEHFRYRAHYDEARGWVEMMLVSDRAQVVRVHGLPLALRAGETIRTEISCKYTPAEFAELACRAGLVVRASWSDPREWYSVFLLEPRWPRSAAVEIDSAELNR